MPRVPDLLCLRKDSMIQSGLDPDNPDCCFHYRMSNFQENFVMYDQLKRSCLQIFLSFSRSWNKNFLFKLVRKTVTKWWVTVVKYLCLHSRLLILPDFLELFLVETFACVVAPVRIRLIWLTLFSLYVSHGQTHCRHNYNVWWRKVEENQYEGESQFVNTGWVLHTRNPLNRHWPVRYFSSYHSDARS